MLRRLANAIGCWLARAAIEEKTAELVCQRISLNNALAQAANEYRECVLSKARILDERDAARQAIEEMRALEDLLRSALDAEKKRFVAVAKSKDGVLRDNELLRDEIGGLHKQIAVLRDEAHEANVRADAWKRISGKESLDGICLADVCKVSMSGLLEG